MEKKSGYSPWMLRRLRSKPPVTPTDATETTDESDAPVQKQEEYEPTWGEMGAEWLKTFLNPRRYQPRYRRPASWLSRQYRRF